MSRYGELRAEFEDGATPGGISTKSFIFRYFDLYVRLFFFSRPVGKLHDESGDGIAKVYIYIYIYVYIYIYIYIYIYMNIYICTSIFTFLAMSPYGEPRAEFEDAGP